MSTENDPMTINYLELGLTKEEALLALWQNSRAQGISFIHLPKGEQPTVETMKQVLDTGTYIDYLMGKAIKVDFSGNSGNIRIGLYDRDNGTGAAALSLITFSNEKKKQPA